MTCTSATRRRLLQAGVAAPFATSMIIRDANSQTAIPVTIAHALKLANYGPVFVAQRQGLFEKQGLNVSIEVAGSIAEPVAIALSGRAQIATTGTGMSVNSTLEGGRMKCVAKMCGALGLWVITRPETAFKSLDDFKGKKVASFRFPSNTVTSPTFAMRKYGNFDPQAAGVQFIEGPFGSIVPAVKDGRADVGVVFEWDASVAATQHGLNVSYGLAEQIGPILFTAVMVKEDYIKTNPDVIQRYCNAIAGAMKMIRENKAAYVNAMAAEFNNLPRPTVEAGCDRLLATRGFVPTNPIISKVEWDAIMEHETVAKTVRKAMTFEEMVDNRFAEKAAAEFGLRS